MGFRDRLKRLSRETDDVRWDLRCPECGWEITLLGDVPVDLIVHGWEQSQPESGRASSAKRLDPNLAKLAEHRHDPEDFIEKRSGLPLYHPAVSGMSLGQPPPSDTSRI